MIDHGLVEAHSFPLVSYGKLRSEYVSWRMPASEAWRFPEVEQRTPNSWPVLVYLDVDGADASARIHEAIFGGRISVPNWVVQRRASGGCHAFWTLKRPPLYGVDAAPGPVSLYTRIAEWYTAALDADPDFIAALSHNAVYQGGEFATDWLATEAYSLAALARPIPKGWKRPPRVKLQSAAGRNSSLFNAGMKWAGSIHRAGMAVLPVPGGAERRIRASPAWYRSRGDRPLSRALPRPVDAVRGASGGPGNHTYGGL